MGDAKHDTLFDGPGAMRERCRRVDWAATPLGPTRGWPGALRAAVRLCLASRVTMAIWAGPEHVLVHNEGYDVVLGARGAWALGARAKDVWSDVWELGVRVQFEDVFVRGAPLYEKEARFRLARPTGEEDAFFDYSLTPLADEDGSVVAIVNILEETTGSVRERVAREELVAFALAAARVGAWDVDLVGGSARRSPEHARIFGYAEPPASWTFDDFLAHVAPEDRGDVARAFRDAVAVGGELAFECRVARVDGEERWISVAGRCRRDEHGERRVAGIVQDVTERRRAEAALRQSQVTLELERARLQAIVDTLPVGLTITDASGRVTLMNDEVRRVWGGSVALENIADTGAYVGFRDDTGERLGPADWPAARALVHGERTKGVVIDVERFDGRSATILVSAAPILDAAGVVTGAVSALQDVSALREAQARVEEADRRKAHFLAVLSHELRNPLAAVQNALRVLERAPPGSSQAQRSMAVLGRQVRQLAHLVDDLLDVTRITRGKIQLQRAEVDLAELVARTLEDHASVLEAAGLATSLTRCEGALVVDADASRVAQIVGNLVQNAAKYTPRGGRVDVRVARDDAARTALVEIRDTGAGMPPELVARLFEPFAQADATLDRSQGGLGLGLALVRGLVELHGGAVEARSEGPGRGSTFTVRLPLAAPSHVGAPPSEGEATRAAPTTSS
jgi:PAS domain S-box-containing protein